MVVAYHTHEFQIPTATGAEVAAGVETGKVVTPATLSSSAAFATAAQGALADTAVQPADLATVATSGAYADLTGTPTLGTAAASSAADFATAAQGALADTALQPADVATVATTGAYADLSGAPTLGTAAAENVGYFATAAQGVLADTALQPADTAIPFVDVASAATVDLGAASSTSVNITGTAGPITSLGTSALDGAEYVVKLNGATINAGANLTLPNGGTSWVSSADEIMVFRYDGGVWRGYLQTFKQATNTQATDGTNNARWMSPLRTREAIDDRVPTLARAKLTANRTYYVRTDGSDSNDGLTNTAGGAFLTIQKAADTVAAIDRSIYNVTIQVGAGTYTGAASISGPGVGSGSVSLVGDTTTPSNVVISTTSANAISISNGAIISVGGFKIQTTTSGTGIFVLNGASVTISGGMDYGACAQAHITLNGGRFFNAAKNYTISGGAPSHINLDGYSYSQVVSSTITLSGTPAFSTAFIQCSASFIQCNANTFSGSATGARYSVTANGVIQTFGAGATYLPGNAVGTTASQGQYL